MTIQEAHRRQYLRHTFYTVFLIGPDGSRSHVANTQRKSGMGLIKIMQSDNVQARVRMWPDAETITFKKYADRLEFSNGGRLEFGGTLLENAS